MLRAEYLISLLILAGAELFWKEIGRKEDSNNKLYYEAIKKVLGNKHMV